MARPDEGGNSTPSWIKDDASVEVDIERLEDFALRMRKELELNFQPSYEHGILPNVKELSRKAPFGKGGLPEGLIFREFHSKNLEAALLMIGDVQKSLLAISMAAMSIAAEYSTGDALSKATLDDVSQAFRPTDAKAETLSSLMEKAQKGEATTVGGEEIKLPESITNNDDSVEPANLNEDSNEDGGDVRGESTIAEGEANPYYVPADSEGVEVRKPQDQIPQQ